MRPAGLAPRRPHGPVLIGTTPHQCVARPDEPAGARSTARDRDASGTHSASRLVVRTESPRTSGRPVRSHEGSRLPGSPRTDPYVRANAYGSCLGSDGRGLAGSARTPTRISVSGSTHPSAASTRHPVTLQPGTVSGQCLRRVQFPLAAALRSSGSAGLSSFVRRLHHYYARVRLLRVVHHRLRLLPFPMRSRRTTRRDGAQPSQVPVLDMYACMSSSTPRSPAAARQIAPRPMLPSTKWRASALRITLSMLISSAHIPRYRRFTGHLAVTRARLAKRHRMACSFAAEDFHLLPTHQLAWRSQTGSDDRRPDGVALVSRAARDETCTDELVSCARVCGTHFGVVWVSLTCQSRRTTEACRHTMSPGACASLASSISSTSNAIQGRGP